MRTAEFELPGREETLHIGRALGRLLQAGDVIGLIGDLGAGKTTLAGAIAQGLGVAAPVTSPTFALLLQYEGRLPLIHLDAYRLEHADDLEDLGFRDYLQSGSVLLIEWADRVEPWLPPERLTLTLTATAEADEEADSAPRTLTATARGARYEQLVRDLTARPPKRPSANGQTSW